MAPAAQTPRPPPRAAAGQTSDSPTPTPGDSTPAAPAARASKRAGAASKGGSATTAKSKTPTATAAPTTPSAATKSAVQPAKAPRKPSVRVRKPAAPLAIPPDAGTLMPVDPTVPLPVDPTVPSSTEAAIAPTITPDGGVVAHAAAVAVGGSEHSAEAQHDALDILFVASETQPFSKTGGLADVASALPRALGRLGHRVTVVTPRYRDVPAGEPVGRFGALVADRWLEAEWQLVPLGPGAQALLVDCPPLYDRAGLYNEEHRDYADNAARFAFLSIAALEWASRQPQPPAVLHGHDWQAGLLPVYQRRFGPQALGTNRPSALHAVPTICTIHNIAYQGVVSKEWVPRLGLSWQDFTVRGFEFWDRLSLLKSGVMFSDAITTVSPTYAQEIQRPEYGNGFDGILRSRRDALTGILNGIDTDEWNPAHDPFLPASFSATTLDGKRESKRALLELFDLPVDDAALARPIIGMVSRMVDQKGLDLIAALAPWLTSLDATFTIVGSGEPRFEQMWRGVAAASPGRVGVFVGFDERRAHLVEAGADLFLMPSRFEPCGLNQMYSMRYGTVPLVRAVGGLVDTVEPYDSDSGRGTGFLFSAYEPGALAATISRALEVFRHPGAWRQLQVNGMARDFSWERSAEEYVRVYKGVMDARARPGR